MRTHVKISRWWKSTLMLLLYKKKKTQGKKRRFNEKFFPWQKWLEKKNTVHSTHPRRFFKTSVEKSLLGKAQYCSLWRLYWYESNGTWIIAYKCYTSHLRHDLFILRTIKGLKRMLSRQKKIILVGGRPSERRRRRGCKTRYITFKLELLTPHPPTPWLTLLLIHSPKCLLTITFNFLTFDNRIFISWRIRIMSVWLLKRPSLHEGDTKFCNLPYFFFIKLSKPYPAILTIPSSPQFKIWSTRISDLFRGGEGE